MGLLASTGRFAAGKGIRQEAVCARGDEEKYSCPNRKWKLSLRYLGSYKEVFTYLLK
jgi:hypothetical protein